MPLPDDLRALLEACAGWSVPHDREEILRLALGPKGGFEPTFDVSYDVPGHGRVLEATVTRCKNGLSVNYPDPRMRRRDPDCLVVADALPSDKDRYENRFGEPFSAVRKATFDWLEQQELLVLPLYTGGRELG